MKAKVLRTWFSSPEGRHVMQEAMQRFQDFTYLDENNHRYHCGGSEYRFLEEHILAVLGTAEGERS